VAFKTVSLKIFDVIVTKNANLSNDRQLSITTVQKKTFLWHLEQTLA
jgi:hypothetical protein